MAFSARDLNASDVMVSIVGTGVVGKKRAYKRDEFKELFTSVDRKLRYIVGFAILISALVFGFSIFSVFSDISYIHEVEIADLYIKIGHPELAIDSMKAADSYYGFYLFPNINSQLQYKLAMTYAVINNPAASVFYLEKAIEKQPEILQLVKYEKAFDAIRTTPEFILFLKKNQ